MKNSIIAFLLGLLTAAAAYLKFKKPEVVNVSGDLIEEQKIKDNRKDKSRTKLSRADKRKARKDRRALRRANK